MVDTEGVIQSKTVLVQPINEQQATTNEENPDKENFTNGTINNIHTFLFDILAFFFNSQSSLIAEYCQETQNWNFIQRFFNDEDTHILPIFYCDPQERNRLSKGSSIVLPDLNRSTKIEETCIGIGLDKPFEDGGVIFMKPNAIKLTDKNYKNVCEFMVEMNY